MRSLLPLACALALLTACGGGGDDGESLALLATLDGFVTDNAFVDTNSGSVIAAGDTDGSFSNVARGFVRFDRSSIPAGATIVSAVLRLHQSAVTGAPFATLGGVVVDHVDVGVALDSTDFGAMALSSGIGTISGSATLGPRQLDVTGAVLADVAAARSTSDFRLRFPVGSDGDAADDYVQFNDSEDNVGNGEVPELVITYEL